eukprot:CAMPEP_0116830968 /NCGR_PEP_ID=MMETSP0418-20121206/5067_1 /TAXON_ID=1158023 /ORGANISM="Astrosyne radiata, Strain 13vi08-1A" /LENGTH=219 /DNA_ID=CAMNT_0004460149 /DNA_START=84 /DNA_END=744 /DNA_ORIENTATION=+
MTKQIELPVDRFASGNSSESDQLAETENDTETRKVEFKIWDTAGQEKYQSLAPMYYRGAAAAIVVYDICSLPSFRMLQKWIDEMKTNGPPAIVIAICGNKSDLEEKRQVPKDEAEKYSQKMGGFYVETSARDDSNVKGLFEEIARRVPILEEGEGISAAEDGVGALSLGIKNLPEGGAAIRRAEKMFAPSQLFMYESSEVLLAVCRVGRHNMINIPLTT